MNEIKIRIIPAIGLFFCISCFFFWLSENFYPENYIGYGFVGALLCAITFFYTVKGIQDTEDFTSSIPKKFLLRDYPLFDVLIVSFLFFVFCWIYLSSMYANIKENELKAFGKITTADVIDGYSLTGGNVPGTYKVTVEYFKDSEKITAYTNVSPTEFQNCYLGKTVTIVYSTKNSGLIAVIGDDSSTKTYVNVENKDITVTNLIKIIDLDDAQTLKYLNTISYPWIYNSYQKGWSNEDKKSFLIKNQKNTVSFLNSELNPSDFRDQLDQLKFKEISTKTENLSEAEKIKQKLFSAEGTYENDNYLIIVKNTLIGNNGQIGMVITILKK
ncbi:hypothetical protein OX283_010265 [Flavobacterium sp. SUN052]|uniref:hypothetical protein n=1 Tax=Flavobacterium sp. SUN052 TaxID=3002441 RepID=UPI00237EBCB5|nr:hypothetical protein [Flavobacterium sp. SUN052]MEC4005042.1 hypothetical protein [Flavobacterium sp. SUN052]